MKTNLKGEAKVKEAHCPVCKDTCKPRMIGKSKVYDCDGCKDQIAEEAVEWWIAK